MREGSSSTVVAGATGLEARHSQRDQIRDALARRSHCREHQNFQLPYSPRNKVAVSSYEPTTFPRPPSATGRLLCRLVSRVPPYRYSVETPQVKVLLAWCWTPTPKRQAEFTGSNGETSELSWNSYFVDHCDKWVVSPLFCFPVFFDFSLAACK